MTEYIVLYQAGEHSNGQPVWVQVQGTFAARSARGAISAALEAWPDDLGGGGSFCATPHRSWKPVQVKVETKTALKFS